MKINTEILKGCTLFEGISSNDLYSMLDCLNAETKIFGKKENVAYEGDGFGQIGILLSGKLQLERTDYYGNRSIITSIEPSELFGEAFACADARLTFDIVSVQESRALLIDCKRIITTCSNGCDFHNRIIQNLLKVVSAKNIMLNQKAEIISMRTTREKLLAYLMLQAKRNQANDFTIPFDRQELADFLEVDRSGLSNEISKLRNEGVIESRKNRFKLL